VPFPAGRAGHADTAGELPVPCECRHTASNRSQSGVCLKWCWGVANKMCMCFCTTALPRPPTPRCVVCVQKKTGFRAAAPSPRERPTLPTGGEGDAHQHPGTRVVLVRVDAWSNCLARPLPVPDLTAQDVVGDQETVLERAARQRARRLGREPALALVGAGRLSVGGTPVQMLHG